MEGTIGEIRIFAGNFASLQDCGHIERPYAGEELLAALFVSD